MLSIEADDALRNVNRLRAFYIEAKRSIIGWSLERRSRMGIGAHQAELRTLRESIIVRCVTVLEAFAGNRAQALLRERLSEVEIDPRVPLAARAMIEWLRESQADAATQWGGAATLWREAYDIDINKSGSPNLKEVRATRHAIVHTGGVYTRSYRKQAKSRLTRAGIDPSRASGTIPIDEQDVTDAFVAAERFVRWLDERSRT
jgi:hypothetical protein